MGDHYVPQFYLKGFSVAADSDLIWVYRKGAEEAFKTAIHNIAQENRLYSREMEEYLANIVEAPANIIIQKIRDLQILTYEDKVTLSNYMMALWKRVPKQKKMVRDKAPEIMNPVFERIDNELIEQGNKYPSKINLVEKRRRELREQRNSKENEFIYDIWLANIPPDKTPQSVDVLSQMTWRFLLAENEQYFITSDNPLFFFPWMGIGKEHSEVAFPITKKIALWATWRMDLNEGFFPTRTQVVKEINRRTVSYSNQYIFSPCSESWIRTLANKGTYRLNRIV